MRFIGDRDTEAYYEALVGAIDIPRPFSVVSLVAAVARQHGCEIALEPLPPEVGPQVSGSVRRRGAGYLMQLPVGAELWWVPGPAAHEVAHIVCGHVQGEGQLTSRLPDTFRAQSPLVRGAEADWGPMFRCDLSADIEQEAEYVASLLVSRIERLGSRSRFTSPALTGGVVDRFTRVLGSRRDRRR